MSDLPPTSHPGTISHRDVDTHRYRVLRELPNPKMPSIGAVFEAWPQGEVFAFVSGVGLGVCRNSDIAEWVAAGLVEREGA